MSAAEFALYKQYIDQASTVVEFGSGGSTVYCLQSDCMVASIESAPWFMRSMKRLSIVKKSILNKKLFYEHGNIGVVGAWGTPVDKNILGERYWLKPLQKICTQQKAFLSPDIVFIDGRFRVACLLIALKKLHSINNIIIHDYTNREYYHIIEKYASLIVSVDSLAVFTPKDTINMQELEADLELYKNDFR